MRLFAFGSNGSGQLALGHKEDVSSPTQCLFSSPTIPDDEIIHMAAGGNHTLLLTKRGCVYAAGCNSDGRCGPTPSTAYDESTGSVDKDDLLRFRRVLLTDETGLPVEFFKCVSATWEGSVLVALNKENEDRIFVLGSSPKGELGLGSGVSSAMNGMSLSLSLPPGTSITALASGMGHSVAVTSNGDVLGWGGARKGQLGDSLKGQKILWTPAKVEGIPFRATAAVCGREFTVIVGQREAGEFMVLGDRGNRWGILNVPSLGGMGYSDIGASWHGIYVHIAPEAGNSKAPVIAWGRDDRGQLPPPRLPEPVQVAVGSEHVLALLEGGEVATFGWGEHGNCGPDTDEKGNVAGTFNLVSLPDSVRAVGAKVVGVGAGCATSWLNVK
ncbi:uncharacterized protein N7443_004959 [Penicillium atrosanguineum]|uniref:uncharacterized protein n=1 Tax=Penicillium atrosanguineum TaxID=1132637 RepID=UPI0023A357DB|nr:uncharacterized protein N7443_004959 [Penicillium atrosanguineum]KAJ5305299.1 hypothetical protein N7443_004959 [Penicillium atrosanguineum]